MQIVDMLFGLCWTVTAFVQFTVIMAWKWSIVLNMYRCIYWKSKYPFKGNTYRLYASKMRSIVLYSAIMNITPNVSKNEETLLPKITMCFIWANVTKHNVNKSLKHYLVSEYSCLNLIDRFSLWWSLFHNEDNNSHDPTLLSSFIMFLNWETPSARNGIQCLWI